MIVPVVLSGGAGSRLWPVSRKHFPKQLHALNESSTLLQATVARFKGLDGLSAPIVICNEEHRFMVAEQLRVIGADEVSIVLEPAARNTAPAIAAAASIALANDPEAILVVLPADHAITDEDGFRESIAMATEYAAAGSLVTFGVTANQPNTGFGYIKRGQSVDPETARVWEVERFTEKPDADLAQHFLASGDYLWNAGIFMFTARCYLDELTSYQPAIAIAAQRSVDEAKHDGDFIRLSKAFLDSPSNSIDYAVMENAQQVVVVQIDIGWSDIGSWRGLWDISSKDPSGNVIFGDVETANVGNTLIRATHRLVSVVGVHNLAIVETADAVLVSDLDDSAGLKKLVQALETQGRTETTLHKEVFRPWGSYEGLDTGDRYQVKRLRLLPGASISLQRHHKRAEHWIVVRGKAQVRRDDDSFVLGPNQSTYIPAEAMHKLENIGDEILEVVEVQTGSYFGEDDIERFEDKYGRV